jgi:hypothetical protein
VFPFETRLKFSYKQKRGTRNCGINRFMEAVRRLSLIIGWKVMWLCHDLVTRHGIRIGAGTGTVTAMVELQKKTIWSWAPRGLAASRQSFVKWLWLWCDRRVVIWKWVLWVPVMSSGSQTWPRVDGHELLPWRSVRQSVASKNVGTEAEESTSCWEPLPGGA